MNLELDIINQVKATRNIELLYNFFEINEKDNIDTSKKLRSIRNPINSKKFKDPISKRTLCNCGKKLISKNCILDCCLNCCCIIPKKCKNSYHNSKKSPYILLSDESKNRIENAIINFELITLNIRLQQNEKTKKSIIPIKWENNMNLLIVKDFTEANLSFIFTSTIISAEEFVLDIDIDV